MSRVALKKPRHGHNSLEITKPDYHVLIMVGSTSLTSQPQPIENPLSELTLISPSHIPFFIPFFNGLNSIQTLHFHVYKHEPAIFSLYFDTHSARSEAVSCVLHLGASPKVAPFGHIFGTAAFLELSIGEVGSRAEKEKNGDWVWKIPNAPHTWETKMALPDYDVSKNQGHRELKFRWQHMTLELKTTSSLVHPDWKLISINGEEEVHAALVMKKNGGRERGTIQFRRSYGREWEMGVLLLAGVLSDRDRMLSSKVSGFTKGFMYM
jgi:hypothetical protein